MKKAKFVVITLIAIITVMVGTGFVAAYADTTMENAEIIGEESVALANPSEMMDENEAETIEDAIVPGPSAFEVEDIADADVPLGASESAAEEEEEEEGSEVAASTSEPEPEPEAEAVVTEPAAIATQAPAPAPVVEPEITPAPQPAPAPAPQPEPEPEPVITVVDGNGESTTFAVADLVDEDGYC